MAIKRNLAQQYERWVVIVSTETKVQLVNDHSIAKYQYGNTLIFLSSNQIDANRLNTVDPRKIKSVIYAASKVPGTAGHINTMIAAIQRLRNEYRCQMQFTVVIPMRYRRIVEYVNKCNFPDWVKVITSNEVRLTCNGDNMLPCEILLRYQTAHINSQRKLELFEVNGNELKLVGSRNVSE